MWILLVVAFSGGASSSNMMSVEFSTKERCEHARKVLKTPDEVKFSACVPK